ncbi:hypothetical protein YQE_04582, partial [Dendroctonus ponderosae]
MRNFVFNTTLPVSFKSFPCTLQLSSPNLNNLTVTGCILVYVSVILFGLHSVNWFSDLCSLVDSFH